MKHALTNALEQAVDDESPSVDRILAAAFFRKRPLPVGASAEVVTLGAGAAKDRQPEFLSSSGTQSGAPSRDAKGGGMRR